MDSAMTTLEELKQLDHLMFQIQTKIMEALCALPEWGYDCGCLQPYSTAIPDDKCIKVYCILCGGKL